MKSIILAAALIAGIVQARAAMPGIDALVGSGHAIEICNADLNKQAAMTSSAGITLVKTSATQLSIQGFYNGNFNVTMDYMMGKGTIAEGPYKALEVKPDGRTADYAGKYLRVKRVLGINTAIGAVYFDIPDTLGLRQGLEALMTLSTECEANACGGYDCTLKGIKVEGELASQIISIIGNLIPSDGNTISPETLEQLIAALGKDTDISVGALQLQLSDDEQGAVAKTLATMESYTFSSYVANAAVTDRYDVSRNTVSRSYPAAVTLEPDSGRFSILNFGNAGYALSHSIDDVTVEHTDTAGNVTTTTTKVLNTRAQAIQGTIDIENGTFVIPAQAAVLDLSRFNSLTGIFGDASIGNGRIWKSTKKSVIGWTDASSSDSDLKGTVSYDTAEPYHIGSNLWHSGISGGDLHTMASGLIVLSLNDTYSYKWNTPFLLNTKYFIDATTITAPYGDATDITHDVSFGPATYNPGYCGETYHEFGINHTQSGNSLDVYGTLLPQEETETVDHYEVYIHHTGVNRISTGVMGMGGNYSATDGLTGSLKVCDVVVPESAQGSSFCTRVGIADIPNNNSKSLFGTKPDISPSTDEFTLYVKTVYNNGLAPTFHALTVCTSAGHTTTVANLSSDIFRAYTLPGAIHVDAPGAIAIYTPGGICVYSGAPGIISLSDGLYLIRSGEDTLRIMLQSGSRN